MAKYKSLVEIRGAIDDLVFYNLNGIPVVRKKSGFNKDAYQNNPKYAKVRENSNEFGHASKSGKLLRDALNEYVKDCGDKLMYQKFAKVMTQIKDLDTKSERGNRKVQLGLEDPSSINLLKDFKFGNINNLNGKALRSEGLFTIPIEIKNTDADCAILVTIQPDFNNYKIISKNQNLALKSKQNLYEFEKQIDTNNTTLLYFLVLKKNEEILNMGFI